MTTLDKCPKCGGVADNGHDRCMPPSPYWRSKYEKECNAALREQLSGREICNITEIKLKTVGETSKRSKAFIVEYAADAQMLKPPVYTWKYSFGGDHWYLVESAPNALRRFAQRIILGIVWERERPSNKSEGST